MANTRLISLKLQSYRTLSMDSPRVLVALERYSSPDVFYANS